MADAPLIALGDCARWSLRLPLARAQQLGELAGYRIALDINRAARVDERLAARLGPDEWLLCGPHEEGFESKVEAAFAGAPHSLVDIGHRYVAFAVDGAKAPLLLSSGCPLDLHPAALVEGTATRTLLGKAEIILWRLGGWRVECARSFARYVHAFLREAARELD